MDKIEFRSGLVEEVDKIGEDKDAYYKIKVQRNDGTHYFVKLLVGSIPPKVGEMAKFPRLRLVMETNKGIKFWEEVPVETTGNKTYVPAEGAGEPEKIDTEVYMGLDSFDQAMYLTTQAMQIVISACPELIHDCNTAKRIKACLNIAVEMYVHAKRLEEASMNGIKNFFSLEE